MSKKKKIDKNKEKTIRSINNNIRSSVRKLNPILKGIVGKMPGHLPESKINTDEWKVPPVPVELRLPGIEISGPASMTGMFINALNPGPDGGRTGPEQNRHGCRDSEPIPESDQNSQRHRFGDRADRQRQDDDTVFSHQ